MGKLVGRKFYQEFSNHSKQFFLQVSACEDYKYKPWAVIYVSRDKSKDAEYDMTEIEIQSPEKYFLT